MSSRHKGKTKNWRKLEEADRERAVTNVSFTECKYSILIKHHSHQNAFLITILDGEHNHAMALDPFVFQQHKSTKDTLRDEAFQLGLGLRQFFIKYNQAKRTLRTQGLNICHRVL